MSDKKYMVFGSLEVKLPEKMISTNKSGTVGLKQTTTKTGQFSKIGSLPAVKVDATTSNPEINIIKPARITTVKKEKLFNSEIKRKEAKAKQNVAASSTINRAIKGHLARKKINTMK